MNSNNISFNINFHVSTTREEIKRQLQLQTIVDLVAVEADIVSLVDQIAEAFVDGDYQHAFLDEGGRFDPMCDDGTYLVHVIECVLDLYVDSLDNNLRGEQ